MTLPLKLDANGLVPVVVHDRLTGDVRMVAFANEEAVRATLATGRATFFSRSRGELWEKGKTSGNGLRVVEVLVDCDADTLIYRAEPEGPSCHTGSASCFTRALDTTLELRDTFAPQTLLGRLEAELAARKSSTKERSYTKSLYAAGPPKLAAKLAEEARELGDAIAGEGDARVASEAADLLYHMLVGLQYRDVPLRRVLAVLDARFGQSGHEEKAARKNDER